MAVTGAEPDSRADRLVAVVVCDEEPVVRRNQAAQLAFLGVEDELLELAGAVRLEPGRLVRALPLQYLGAGRLRRHDPGKGEDADNEGIEEQTHVGRDITTT